MRAKNVTIFSANALAVRTRFNPQVTQMRKSQFGYLDGVCIIFILNILTFNRSRLNFVRTNWPILNCSPNIRIRIKRVSHFPTASHLVRKCAQELHLACRHQRMQSLHYSSPQTSGAQIRVLINIQCANFQRQEPVIIKFSKVPAFGRNHKRNVPKTRNSFKFAHTRARIPRGPAVS